MQKNINLDTLGDLDGGAARAIIDHEIARAVADVDDRGEDDKARKVAIELTLKRLGNGLIETTVTAQAKLPARQTNATFARPKHSGGGVKLQFQEFDNQSPDQMAFDDKETT